MMRSRWAAIGAAVAVTLGAGGLAAVSAAEDPSVFVPTTPARVLDTRAANSIGLDGPFSSGASRKLDVTGVIETQTGNQEVVPAGATAIVFNVTVVSPRFAGFVSIRPGDASGAPGTSSLNFRDGASVANGGSVRVPLTGANAGQVDILFQGSQASETVNLLLDVSGYYVPGSAAGPAGPAGPRGAAGSDATMPANVVWVAESGGDFTSLSAALASITDASFSNPYVIKIAPGVYTETSTVEVKDDVDIEGSGEGVTTITCACASGATLNASPPSVSSEVRHLEIRNTGGGTVSTAISSNADLSLLHVTADASGGTTTNVAVSTSWSDTRLEDVGAYARGGTESFGVRVDDASPTLIDVIAIASGSAQTAAIEVVGGSPKIENPRVISRGTSTSTGVLVDGGTPTISGGTIDASDGSSTSYGVSNVSGAETIIDGTSITASGGSIVIGVSNSATVTMSNVTVTASGGSSANFAVNNDSGPNPSAAVIRSSSLSGDDDSVVNSGSSSTAMIAGTMLDPAPGPQTNMTCVGAYNQAFVELSATCA